MSSSGSTALGHHDPPDEHDHADPHDDHDDEHGPVENPRWVLLPLAVGMVIGLILAIAFGLGSGVRAFV